MLVSYFEHLNIEQQIAAQCCKSFCRFVACRHYVISQRRMSWSAI